MKFRWWDLEISQALAQRSILILGFPLASNLIGIIASNHRKNIPSLIPLLSLTRSTTSLFDQLHILNLIPSPLGPLLSRNLLTPIPQRSFRSQASIRPFETRVFLNKAYTQALSLESLLALLREPIALLLKQATHLIESLLHIGLGITSLSYH